MVQRQVKLKLRPSQERTLVRWLWHLTGAYNWAVRKIELDAADGRFYSTYTLESLLLGHNRKVGIPRDYLSGTVRSAHESWQRCFRRQNRKPKLRGSRNRLNGLPLPLGIRGVMTSRFVALPGLGRVRFHQQDLPAGHIGSARIVRRASGWYLCLFIKADRAPIVAGSGEVGIDPGFASLVTLSTGEHVEHPHELKAGAIRLGQAQRGNRTRLTARLLERQANRRKDRNHKLSLRLVKQNSLIAWSADKSANLAKAFGKSVASAGHYQLRTMLDYKCRTGGSRFVAVPSRNSTRTCSSCRSLSGPTGWRGLSVRHWVCVICGVEHERTRPVSRRRGRAMQLEQLERAGDA